MVLLSVAAALVLAVAPSGDTSPPEPTLSAQQYLQVDDIYRKVVDACCLRKEAARKVHLEIEQMVAAGQPPEKIAAVLVARFNREREHLAGERQPYSQVPGLLARSVLAALIGGVVMAAWFVVRGARTRP